MQESQNRPIFKSLTTFFRRLVGLRGPGNHGIKPRNFEQYVVFLNQRLGAGGTLKAGQNMLFYVFSYKIAEKGRK